MPVFESEFFDQHEMLAFKHDSASGLTAIIAIHSTALGPAMGGCRMFPYPDSTAALDDVLRLSRGMTLKSALAGLPYGGGKAVIIGNPRFEKTREKLLAMGQFIDSLGGQYLTAEDSGTNVADMRVIAEQTGWVSGISALGPHAGDPSPYTARSVFNSITTALAYRFGSAELTGRSVAVQGAGAVGLHLVMLLREAGAQVYVAELNELNRDAARRAGATLVDVSQIMQLKADVLAPCAMGAVINDETLPHINAAIIAGSANNQLLSARHGEQLRQRGILYAPDFVVNAGGIIDVHYQHVGGSARDRDHHIESMSQVLLEVFHRADAEGVSTNVIAEQLAQERIAAPAQGQDLHRRFGDAAIDCEAGAIHIASS